jgi:hypothetical protein
MYNRKYERVGFDCEIMYPSILIENKTKTITEPNLTMHIVDISESGICVSSNYKIPSECFLSFYLRIGGNIPFKVLVIPRWIKLEENHCICGGEFVALSMSDINILKEYVSSHSTGFSK